MIKLISISAAKCVHIQWDKSDQFSSYHASKCVLNDCNFSELFRFQIHTRDCALVFCALCVIIPSSIFGAFWRPDVGGFICRDIVRPGRPGILDGWGEEVRGAHGNRSGLLSSGQNNFSHFPSSCPPADSTYLRQVAEVFVQNGIIGAVQEFREVTPQEMECIGCGQMRKEFLLLCLVVQDFCLWIAEEKKSRRFRRLLHAPSTFSYPQGHKRLKN